MQSRAETGIKVLSSDEIHRKNGRIVEFHDYKPDARIVLKGLFDLVLLGSSWRALTLSSVSSSAVRVCICTCTS